MPFPETDRPKILEMIRAKIAKDFSKADALRVELTALGYGIEYHKDCALINYPLGLAQAVVYFSDMEVVPFVWGNRPTAKGTLP